MTPLSCICCVLGMIAAASPALAAGQGDDLTIRRATHTAGSDAVFITTDSYYYQKERCIITTELVISSVTHNGHKRNNPDGTFYPGDSFKYETSVSFDGCTATKACAADILVDDAADAHDCPPLEIVCWYNHRGVCRPYGFSGTSGSGGVTESGTVDIPHDVYGPETSYSIEKRSYAMAKYIVKHSPGGVSFGYSRVVSVASFPITVIAPDLSIDLGYRPLTDSDGYLAANLDGTYYVWDPVHVKHEATYAWKDERIGTIGIGYDMDPGMLDIVYEYGCHERKCAHAVDVSDAYDAWNGTYGFGGGSTVYNSTCIKAGTLEAPACGAYHRRHTISYTARLYNIDPDAPLRTGPDGLDHVNEVIEPLVVMYAPRFKDPLPYISLRDERNSEGNTSWSKRHVVAAEYLGSAGGGIDDADDADTPRPMRRALINHADYDGRALFLTGSLPISETLKWDGTGGPSDADGERCGEHDASLEPHAIEFGRSGQSAMFTKAGYGRIYFEYPISGFMEQNNARTAVLNNTLSTKNFAGLEILDLLMYSYAYPYARFGVPIRLALMDSEGVVEDGSVSVEITPVLQDARLVPEILRSAEEMSYMHDRICINTMMMTGDEELANMMVSDMYPRSMHASSQSGQVHMIMNKTGALFNDLYAHRADRSLDPNDIYEAPSAYKITYSVGSGSTGIMRTVTGDVLFTSPISEIANLDQDNELDYSVSCPECHHTTVQLRPKPEFGAVAYVMRNDERVNHSCSTEHGCTVSALKGVDNEFVLVNTWGGRASAVFYVPPAASAEPEPADADIAVILVLVAVGAVVAWQASKIAIAYVQKRVI